MDDLKLCLKEFNKGNMDAFSQIYEELKTPIYTIIYRILYDRPMSEDVMQEVFIKLYNKPPSLQIENPRAYIFQMARNLAIDNKRKLKESEPLSHKTESNGISIEYSVNTRLDLESALKNLELDDREIVTLHLNANLKFREIAKVIDKPMGTVLWKYQKSIKMLRDILSGGEYQ